MFLSKRREFFTVGLFIESVCTKILQARGNMMVPMMAQVTGSVINIVLDIVLIFGAGFATIVGQWAAMGITLFCVVKKYSLRGKIKWNFCKQIYVNGVGSIVTQSLYTFYIVGLNMILKTFTENAVTVLGIYYKIQSFFFIPLLGFQQVLLPLFSYHITRVIACVIILMVIMFILNAIVSWIDRKVLVWRPSIDK